MDIGVFNELKIARLTPQGAVLEVGEQLELQLPAAEVPADCQAGDTVKVFLYLDGEDRPVATTVTPVAQVREVGYLKIVSVKDAGAFLNWGLPKDLLLPWAEVKREQRKLIVEGRRILVCVFRAEDGRVAASARLDDFIQDEATGFKEGDRVQVILADRTEIGQRVIVNHSYWGMVHNNEIFGTLHRGQSLDGYVKALRLDGKLNITLSAPGYQKIDTVAQGMLKVLQRSGGFLAVSDKTPPEEIHKLFGISKKVFKQTLGALYRERRISLEGAGIRFVEPAPADAER